MTTSVPIVWRLNSQRYSLQGSECPDCHHVSFPPREACAYCAEQVQSPFLLGSSEVVTEELVEAGLLIEAHA